VQSREAKTFIASSAESLDVAYAVQENLERDAEVTVWSQGVFDLSKYTLDSLVGILADCDFGVFVFTPNDTLVIRDQAKVSVRDNVVFELGMFIGALGRERCFILIPRGYDDMQFPTDLLGLTPGLFEAKRTDGNLGAALGAACNQIRKKIRSQGKRIAPGQPSPVVTANNDSVDALTDDDALSILESWLGSRPSGENRNVLYFSEVDRELRLKPGTAARLLEQAALRWNYYVRRRGQKTILLDE
jgi:hypothetical protein